ncbi:MAG: S41 family peptidase [Alistipes sp.]|jgi:peptidase, S41 family|uniref:S41 family peptidase n=1 Tax=Alistipes sp. TaxID=1872444 RepID=UPI001D4866CB|nr:S41 family peptidase [Alistipes sp.]MBS6099715.1 S41 family peptidase [Alistipes sp.]HJI20002.1 S41 family peptidase [Rikenellaceae bacterium]
MNSKRLFRRAAGLAAALLALGALTFAGRNDFGLGRNTEILINLMRELSLNYVDEVSPDRLMQQAAAGMTRTLDPYTEFMPEEQMSDFELLTTGKYGGVGSLIRKKGDYVIFAQPYKGSPADRAGIRIGDRIVRIDGQEARGMTIEQVSALLKGSPGTKVKLTVERLLGGEQQELTLRRERIAIPSVPYYGYVADGIGYIQHSDFTEGSYDELRAALEALQREGELRGLILDYRSNGGGILQEAVKIVSLFVPKGTEVVSTRGRAKDAGHTFRTESAPVAPNLPLAVLVNGNTASSAEIVAGALQDLDRAVLIGQKTFGKGLVQSTRPLGYNTMVKMTTAKYYMPSGRCIQAIDYSAHEGRGGAKQVPDSLVHAFTTRAGRTVYDGGGITPDLRTEPQYVSRFAMTLYALGFIEDFVDDYMREHAADTIDNRTFSITDADYDRFVAFMQDKEVPYESDTRRVLKSLKTAAGNDRYTELEEEIARLESQLKDDKLTNLATYRGEITDAINSDVVLRHSYVEGVVEHGLTDDREVAEAVRLLDDPAQLARMLSPEVAQPDTEQEAAKDTVQAEEE